MEQCLAVETFVDKILSRFSSYSEEHVERLNKLISHVTTLQRELLTDVESDAVLSIPAIMIWEQCIKKIRGCLSKFGSEHRDIHSSVSKCGREIDKNFVSDFSTLYHRQNYEVDGDLKNAVMKLIAEHFLTQGQLDLAESIAVEAGLDLERSNKAVFVEMNAILDAIKSGNLDPVLRWAQQNREQLAKQNSELEFSIHRLRFIEFLKQGPSMQFQAVAYARNFAPFASKHGREIEILMGSMLFLHTGLQQSPYAEFLDPIQWAQLADMFTKDACSLLGLSVTSPLTVILNAGASAVPALLNLRQVMLQRQVMGMWSAVDELPIEVDLGPEGRFHSIFTCPILRQQTTDSNPPLRLFCGHVISKEALQKLANNNNKLKCPYCPVESSVNEARQVYF